MRKIYGLISLLVIILFITCIPWLCGYIFKMDYYQEIEKFSHSELKIEIKRYDLGWFKSKALLHITLLNNNSTAAQPSTKGSYEFDVEQVINHGPMVFDNLTHQIKWIKGAIITVIAIPKVIDSMSLLDQSKDQQVKIEASQDFSGNMSGKFNFPDFMLSHGESNLTNQGITGTFMLNKLLAGQYDLQFQINVSNSKFSQKDNVITLNNYSGVLSLPINEYKLKEGRLQLAITEANLQDIPHNVQITLSDLNLLLDSKDYKDPAKAVAINTSVKQAALIKDQLNYGMINNLLYQGSFHMQPQQWQLDGLLNIAEIVDVIVPLPQELIDPETKETKHLDATYIKINVTGLKDQFVVTKDQDFTLDNVFNSDNIVITYPKIEDVNLTITHLQILNTWNKPAIGAAKTIFFTPELTLQLPNNKIIQLINYNFITDIQSDKQNLTNMYNQLKVDQFNFFNVVAGPLTSSYSIKNVIFNDSYDSHKDAVKFLPNSEISSNLVLDSDYGQAYYSLKIVTNLKDTTPVVFDKISDKLDLTLDVSVSEPMLNHYFEVIAKEYGMTSIESSYAYLIVMLNEFVAKGILKKDKDAYLSNITIKGNQIKFFGIDTINWIIPGFRVPTDSLNNSNPSLAPNIKEQYEPNPADSYQKQESMPTATPLNSRLGGTSKPLISEQPSASGPK
jgi:hypothetical protein